MLLQIETQITDHQYCLVSWSGNIQRFDNLKDVVEAAIIKEYEGQIAIITWHGNLVYGTGVDNEIANRIIYNDCYECGLYDTINDVRICEITLCHSMETGYTLVIKENNKKNCNWQNGF